MVTFEFTVHLSDSEQSTNIRAAK